MSAGRGVLHHVPTLEAAGRVDVDLLDGDGRAIGLDQHRAAPGLDFADEGVLAAAVEVPGRGQAALVGLRRGPDRRLPAPPALAVDEGKQALGGLRRVPRPGVRLAVGGVFVRGGRIEGQEHGQDDGLLAPGHGVGQADEARALQLAPGGLAAPAGRPLGEHAEAGAAGNGAPHGGGGGGRLADRQGAGGGAQLLSKGQRSEQQGPEHPAPPTSPVLLRHSVARGARGSPPDRSRRRARRPPRGHR